jgi:hypothetical protein
MPEPKGGEYQIPLSAQPELIQSQPDEVEAFVEDVTRYVAQQYDFLDRQSKYYVDRPAILAEEAANLIDRQELIAKGSKIHEQRRAAIENRAAPKSGAMKRVLNMIISGPIDTSVDKTRLASEIFRDLMNKEGMIGASLCKKPDAASDHLFFLSDHKDHPHEWFYYAQSSQPNISRTLRYVVSEQDGILKSIDGGAYEAIVGNELAEFIYQTKRYSDVVSEDYDLAA